MNDTYLAAENTPFSVAAPGVMANDYNPDSEVILSAELASPPANGTVVLNPDGSFTYTPNTGYTGTDSFTYHLVDNTAITSAATVTLTVQAPSVISLGQVRLNPAPTVQVPLLLAAQGDENSLGGSISFDPTLLGNPQMALGSDASAGMLLVNSSQAANGQLGFGIALPTGQTFFAGSRQVAVLTFTLLNTQYIGPIPVTFSDQPVPRELVDINADDLNAAWQNGSVTVNHPPVAVNDAYTLNENTTLAISAPGVLANDSDPDGDALTAVLVSPPTHGSVILRADGSFSYTPQHNYVSALGVDTFTYQANDGLANSTTATVTLTVNPVGYEGDVAPRRTATAR